MPKRKPRQSVDQTDGAPLRRSSRRKTSSSTPATTLASASVAPRQEVKTAAASARTAGKPPARKSAQDRANKATPPKSRAVREGTPGVQQSGQDGGPVGEPASLPEKQYWLMKAEPESRLEHGVDVKFSIDDLSSKTEPEPWDGIRNYVARNNMRAMKKGDLAFFYHSNCKDPGIVGTMQVVQEHSADLSAHDPKTPYYDASSKPEDPKWSVVHVAFRSKFREPISLKELREMGKMGQPLENMQLLRQSRLSVSRVSPAEWAYLTAVVAERGGEVK